VGLVSRGGGVVGRRRGFTGIGIRCLFGRWGVRGIPFVVGYCGYWLGSSTVAMKPKQSGRAGFRIS